MYVDYEWTDLFAKHSLQMLDNIQLSTVAFS